MSMRAAMKSIATRIRAFLAPQKIDHDFQQEIDTHLDLATQENIRRGMPPEDASRAARIRLGGSTQLKETNRELRGLPFLETALQDLRFAVRMLRKNPGFSAIAILTLALGIGANTAIFSVVYAVLLKPLPYADSQQLFNVFNERAEDGKQQNRPLLSKFRRFPHADAKFLRHGRLPAPPTHAHQPRRAASHRHQRRHR